MRGTLYASFDAVPAPKGASRHIQAIVRGLAAAGLPVEVATLASRATPPPWLGVSWKPLGGPPEGSLLARADAFGAHVLCLAQATPHALWHVRDVWQGVPLALWRSQQGLATPLVWEANGLPSIELPAHVPGLAAEPGLLDRLRALEQHLLSAADRIVVVSPVTARCLEARGADPERLRLIPNGVDLEAFAALPTGDAGPEILYVGTLTAWQGLDTLLSALALLPPPVRLRVVGPAGRGGASRLLARAAALGVAGRVLIAPPVAPEEVPALMARARVCVAPLDASPRNMVQGCCPLKLMEYAAAGKAIVATDLPAVSALVRHGQEAWLAPPEEPAAWAEALARVLADAPLRACLGEAARRRAQGWSWASVQAAWLALYAELGVTPG